MSTVKKRKNTPRYQKNKFKKIIQNMLLILFGLFILMLIIISHLLSNMNFNH